MKILIVAGFFTPVFNKLREKFAAQIDARTIVWVPQVGPHGGPDIRQLRENLNDRLGAGGKEVLVMAAALRGKEFTLFEVDAVAQAGQRKWPDATVTVERVPDAGGWQFVISRADHFLHAGQVTNAEISAEVLKRRLRGKVLCVRERNHTSFGRVLKRAGFSATACELFFDEEIVDHGDDNVIAWLLEKSKTYTRIIYAWHGLKYSGGTELNCPIHQAGDAREAVDRFKQWLLSED